MSSITWDEVGEVSVEGVTAPGSLYQKPGKMARISGIANAFEATLFSGALDDEKIPHWIEENRETAHGNLFELTRSWGSLLVPLDLANKAVSILEEIREVYAAAPEESEE